MKTKRLFLTLATAVLASIGAMAQETEAGETLNVDRAPGMGYGATTATVDFTAAKTFLGVDELTTDMLNVVNPDETEISGYAPYDGWFDGDGVATEWNYTTTKICVKFFQAIGTGSFNICDMNGADELGKTYTVRWALKANEKTYTYTINVTFRNPETVTLPYGNLTEEISVTYGVGESSYTSRNVTLTDAQATAILNALGLASFDAATIYGYNPSDESLITTYAAYDGWRKANGDFGNWKGNSEVPVCVKYTNGKTYECYNIIGCAQQTLPVYWAIANAEKYVLVKINFIYEASETTLTISDAGYATYYSGCAYTMPAGLTGYTFYYDNTAGALKLDETYTAGDLVPHWTGVLIKGEKGDHTIACVGGDDATYNNRLGGSDEAQTIYGWDDGEGNSVLLYKLAVGENGLGWYWDSADGQTLNCAAKRCYLWLTQAEAGYGDAAGAAPRFIPLPGNEATGISQVASKSISSYYDLQGRRVAQPTKGLYIVTSDKGSKKVFIK